MIEVRLSRLFGECDKHLLRMSTAAARMAAIMPLQPEAFEQLDDTAIATIDQFLYRFSKLQDAIGEKLLASILEWLQEPNPKGKPFIDVLNRLEQLGWLDSKSDWLELRKIRNLIAHQYEDDPQLAADGLNTIYAKRVLLESIYSRLKSLWEDRLMGATGGLSESP
jgi:hypothetical protein